MAMSLNRVQLIGNLTRDPEVKQLPGGQVVATFSIATNLTWKDQAGQQQTKTEFHNVVVWRKLAEICGQYLKKGGKVFVEGRLQTRDWEGEDGVKRYRTEVVVENMIMLDSKGRESGESYGGGMERESQGISAGSDSQGAGGQPQKAPVGAEEVSLDDLPF